MKELSRASIQLNWFDRFVGFFSPRALLLRKKAKLYNNWLARKYEGADSGRRTDGWNTGSFSANAEISTSLIRLRDRSRDLVRNNPYAARGIQAIANNVVGRGIKTQIKADTRAEVSKKEKQWNNIWRTWAETTACDYDGVHTLAGIQRLIMRATPESGEVLIRRRRVGERRVIGLDGKPVDLPPFQLQVLEADFLSVSERSSILPNGNQVIQGVEVDSNGRRVAYHLYKSHPGSNDLVFASRFQTIRVPAEEILHVHRVDRPGQLRGVPWLAPVMLRLRDFDLYEDAQLKRQQCAAMFTAFIHDIEGLDEDVEVKDEKILGDKMEPGTMEILPPGKEITLANPPGAENYKEYTSVVLRSIATGLGITYETLVGDLSDVNFSSARMGWLEMQRNIETWRDNMLIAQFLRPTFGWFLEGMELMGQSSSNIRGVFTPPRREMIDPVAETNAMKAAVRAGFKSHPQAVQELGNDPDHHYMEIEENNKMLDQKQIILDTDPRKVNTSGSINQKPTDPETSTPPGNDDNNDNGDGNGDDKQD